VFLLLVGCHLAWGLILPSAAGAAEPASGAPGFETPLASPQVRQSMQDGNYAEARKAIDEAARAKDAPQDYLAYLKGWSYCLEKQYDAAAAAFEQFEKQYPASAWLRRVRFARGVALARKGEFKGAEAVFRGEAQDLLSAERRQRWADVYLGFADGYFRPAKEEQRPDYEKAREFYAKALEIGPRPERRAEVELLLGQCYQKSGRIAEAAQAYARFSAAHPGSPLDVEARFRLGECRLAEGRHRDARRAWRELLANYLPSPLGRGTSGVVPGGEGEQSPRIAEAAFRLAETWHLPAPRSGEELKQGVAALEDFLRRFPAHKLAGQARLDIARSYLHRGRHDDAVACLDRCLKDPGSKDRKELPAAIHLLGRIYRSQKKFAEALAVWREFLAKYPSHEAASTVQQQILDTQYEMAVERYKAGDFAGAVPLLSEFLVKYPLDARGPGILFLFGQMNCQQKKWDAALADWRRLISAHPRTEEASHARYLIARTLEQELGKLDDALETYGRVTSGRDAAAAGEAVARLTRKRLSVTAERVFRSGEAPHLKLVTRNIDAVTVRVYRVDLETYFRKLHAVAGIGDLEVSLIDPDSTFEVKVPGYAKHQEMQSSIPVALPEKGGAGAMAVTVSSRTLEATALLIQSDLEIVVKTAGDEVLVLAENLRTLKPWPGARLLVSNGRQVVAEGTAGDDGTWRGRCEKLPAAEGVRVFAAAGPHVASAALRPRESAPAGRLADTLYLYTDRPAYRIGQPIHVRGCYRQAAGGAYRIADATFTIELLDARNRVIWQQQAAASPLGGFHAMLPMPPVTPPGMYRAVARDLAGHRATCPVQIYDRGGGPAALLVAIDIPRTVYYRGEMIEGTIRAETAGGMPLAGRKVRYQLAQEEAVTAQTDAAGRLRFKIPTADFEAAQDLTLTAALEDQDVAVTRSLKLATDGFAIQLDAARSVFLADEDFAVDAKTTDAEGRPVSVPLVLKVVRAPVEPGRGAQQPVAEHKLTTAPDGTARQRLQLKAGGRYTVRAEGVDRFGNTIAGQLALEISAGDDPRRLRILADRTTFAVGQPAEVQLHWREAPALALVVVHGDRTLSHQFVSLQTGGNRLSIPVTAAMAPQFELSAAVMTNGGPARFHEAAALLSVRRDLQVQVACRAKGDAAAAIRPGDPMEISITTRDPQGKPVAAEVSLALLPQSLCQRFAQPVGPIAEAFYGQSPDPKMETGSSSLFCDRPVTYLSDAQVPGEDQLRDGVGEDQPGRPADTAAPDRARRDAAEAGPIEPGSGDFLELVDWIRANVERSAPPLRRTAPRRATGPAGRQQSPTMGQGMGGMFYCQDLPDLAEDAPPDAAAGMVQPKPASAKPTASKPAAPENEDPFGPSEPAPPKPAAAKPVTAQPPAEDPFAAPASPPAPPVVSLVNLVHEDAGYWNPAVMTGRDGTATLTITLPEEPTAWRIAAKAMTVASQFGETVEPLVVKKDLRARMELPAAFVEGDEADVAVRIENDALDRGPLEVTLKTILGGAVSQQHKTIEVAARGRQSCSFKVQFARPGDGAVASETTLGEATFELVAMAGGHRDVVRRTAAILPHGMPIWAATSGVGTANQIVWVEMPRETPWDAPRLQLIISPTIEESLRDVVTGPSPSSAEEAVNDLMAALALQKLMGAGPGGQQPQARALDDRIRASLAFLILSQKQRSGGWGLESGDGERNTTACGVWALVLAREAGYHVSDEAFKAAVAFLHKEVSFLANRDYEGKSMLLCALSMAGEDEFALANQVHRERGSLGPRALAYLALALARMDHRALAVEALDLLAKGDHAADGALPGKPAAPAPAGGAPAGSAPGDPEVVSLRTLTLQQVDPKSPKIQELVGWLLSHREGRHWSGARATGPAVMAVAAWLAENRVETPPSKLSVSVNGTQVGLVDLGPAAATRVIDVPAALLAKDKQQIAFQLAGRGRFTRQCILRGYVAAERLAGTSDRWQIARTYEPPLLQRDGREIPRGFDVLERPAAAPQFTNTMTQLPLGRRGQVTLSITRHSVAPSAPPPREDLVITESIPAGTRVIASSIEGGFDRVEILPGRLIFAIGSRRQLEPIRYAIEGCLGGVYRAGPTILRSGDGLLPLCVSRPATLAVLPEGAVSSDPYRLSPDELCHLARIEKQQGDRPSALRHLTELVENWSLAAEPHKQSVEMLLDLHLELGPAAKVVQYFEIVREKWPEVEVPFDKVLKVGAAYLAMGEQERSYLVARAAIEGNFSRESDVAGFLEEQGEFLRSIEMMGRLVREYPPEPYLAGAEFALAQRVYAKAAEAAGDPVLRRQKVDRQALVRRAWRMLEAFLTTCPADPAADQAAFAAATALVELKDYREAAEAATRCAGRYPKSDLLDSFWYLRAYADFATGRHQTAIEMCRKVADAQPLDKKTGRPGESRNKWQAVYILGQIHQSLGQAADAVREYRRVADRFPDATLAIAHFLRQSIELAEVTTVRPGKPAEVELRYANIAACDVKVYRVDLLKFYALASTPQDIAEINLAGIRPVYEGTLRLGEGRDYRDMTRTVPLPLGKEGAYLVVCRGEDLHASGLLLVTPLELEIQSAESPPQVRVMVRDATTGRYLSDVAVRVIDTRGGGVVSGTTDLGGAFVAEGIGAAPTVIAQAGGGRAAFSSGLKSLWARLLAEGQVAAGRRAARPRTAAEPEPDEAEPERPRGPVRPLPRGTASAAQPRDRAHEAIDMGGGSEEENEQRIREALDSPTQIEFVETPLQDVIDYLKDCHHIEIQLDKKELESMNIGSDTLVTKNLKGIKLRSALKLILDELGLKSVIHEGILLITSPTKAESEEFLETKIYPVKDLVLVAGGSADGENNSADFDDLIDIITQTVAPKAWDANGGQGTVGVFPNKLCLVVSQTQEVHEQIADLLENLRKVDKLEAAGEGGEKAKPAAAKPKPRQLGDKQTPRVISVIPVIDGGRGRGFGGMGGMGGGFGGMGGMGGMMGGPANRAGRGAQVDLLEGVQNTNRGFQQQGVQNLKKQYEGGKGKGGVNAGGVF
jgi:uncharacterized protein YfaS (alpha-2-macroglobulin family)/TolA-binding protein